MRIATNKKSRNIWLNKQSLPWLPRDVISKYQNLQNTIWL